MQWLAAVREDTPLMVPKPLANHAGALVTRVEASDVPEARDCVVFHWVDGRFYRSKLGPGALEQVGGFMAHLHNHVQSFDFPEGFVRPNLELDGEVGRIVQHGLKHGRELLSDEMCNDIARVVDVIRPTIDSIGKDPTVYNLVHADLHQGNYLFSALRKGKRVLYRKRRGPVKRPEGLRTVRSSRTEYPQWRRILLGTDRLPRRAGVARCRALSVERLDPFRGGVRVVTRGPEAAVTRPPETPNRTTPSQEHRRLGTARDGNYARLAIRSQAQLVGQG
jgi:hypothetical protein